MIHMARTASILPFLKKKSYLNKNRMNRILSGYHSEFVKDYLREGSSDRLFDQASIVQRLLRVPQPEQRTPAWYEMRKEMITASSAATLIPRTKHYMREYIQHYDLEKSFREDSSRGCNPYSNREEFFLDKCGHRTFFGNEATLWGQKYEDVVQAIYSRHIGEHIYNFGLIPHPTLPYLGASPDGISELGKMLEIKVPFRRKITGVPPMYYWVQVQLQLEVCNLEVCDFVECKMSEFDSEEAWYADTRAQQKGLILCVGENKYEYPPVAMTAPDDLLAWADERAAECEYGVEMVHKVYWRLDQLCITRINRCREWFKRIRPVFFNGHLELKQHRRDGARTLLKNQSEKKDKKTMDVREVVLVPASEKSMIADSGFTDSESDSESDSE